MTAGPGLTKRQEMKSGWPLVLTGYTGNALGVTGLFIYTQGLFLKPLQAEFGWSRAEVAMMPTIFGLMLALSNPFSGYLLDRLGMAAIGTVAILALAAGFLALSMMTGDLGSYVAIILLIGLIGSGSATAYIRLVGSHFDRARGLALGITMAGSGSAALVFPAILGRFVEQHGWRSTYQLLAILSLVPLLLIFLFASERRIKSRSVPAIGLTIAEALRTRQFWLLAGCFACGGGAVSGVVPHLIPLLQDYGMTPSQAGALFGVIGAAVIGARLLTGYLCDEIFAPYLTAVILALSAAGFAALMIFGQPMAVVAVLLIGVGLGAEIDLAGYMSARYLGLRSYGTMLGIQYGMFSAGAGVGALAYGMLYDRFGNYQAALGVAIGLLAMSILLVLALGPYPRFAAATPASG